MFKTWKQNFSRIGQKEIIDHTQSESHNLSQYNKMSWRYLFYIDGWVKNLGVEVFALDCQAVSLLHSTCRVQSQLCSCAWINLDILKWNVLVPSVLCIGREWTSEALIMLLSNFGWGFLPEIGWGGGQTNQIWNFDFDYLILRKIKLEYQDFFETIINWYNWRNQSYQTIEWFIWVANKSIKSLIFFHSACKYKAIQLAACQEQDAPHISFLIIIGSQEVQCCVLQAQLELKLLNIPKCWS